MTPARSETGYAMVAAVAAMAVLATASLTLLDDKVGHGDGRG